jgi:hypothetical protein
VAWELWEHRNGYLHAKENSILTHQLDEDIAHQFEMGTRGKPIEIKHQWVRQVVAAKEMMELGATGGFQAERMMMARWLQNQG